MADRSHTRLPGSAGVRKHDPSAQEAPDTRQMLHDMKTEAREAQPFHNQGNPRRTTTPRIGSEEASAENLTSADMKLASGVYEAIFGELSESGASPKSAAPAEEPDAFGETMAGRRSRSSLGGAMAGDGSIAGGGPSQMPTASPAAFAKK